MIGLLVLAQTVQTLAGGIPQAVPPTSFSCDMQSSDGARFKLAGTTPAFRKGADPNGYLPMTLTGDGPELLVGKVSVNPGDASDWFREFQVESRRKGDEVYYLQLNLRREGTSIAHTTHYVSTGRPVPYDYHAVGLCKADFAAAAGGEERGR